MPRGGAGIIGIRNGFGSSGGGGLFAPGGPVQSSGDVSQAILDAINAANPPLHYDRKQATAAQISLQSLPGPRMVKYASIHFSATVSLTATISLGTVSNNYGVVLASIVFAANQDGIWIPAQDNGWPLGGLENGVNGGDFLVLTVPSGGAGVTGYAQIVSQAWPTFE